jgi:hypothetical protein
MTETERALKILGAIDGMFRAMPDGPRSHASHGAPEGSPPIGFDRYRNPGRAGVELNKRPASNSNE